MDVIGQLQRSFIQLCSLMAEGIDNQEDGSIKQIMECNRNIDKLLDSLNGSRLEEKELRQDITDILSNYSNNTSIEDDMKSSIQTIDAQISDLLQLFNELVYYNGHYYNRKI